MTQPLVSIIIPCFNAEGFIGEAIDSALAQTYPNVEVIVIDDGSTDGSLDVIRSFGTGVRWISEPNVGAPGARNRGLELATGTWVQFLDSDDLLYPTKLSRMLPEAINAPKNMLVACHRDVQGAGNGEPDATVRLKEEGDSLIMALGQVVHTVAPLYPTSLLRRLGGYRLGIVCCQDYELHLRIALDGWSFKIVDEALFLVRRRQGSISSNLLKVYRQQVALWEEILPNLDAEAGFSPQRRAAIARLFASRGRWFNRRGLYTEADQCFVYADMLDAAAAATVFGSRTAWLKTLLGKRLADRMVCEVERPLSILRSMLRTR